MIAAVLTASAGMFTGCGGSSSGGTETEPEDPSTGYEDDSFADGAVDINGSEEVTSFGYAR